MSIASRNPFAALDADAEEEANKGPTSAPEPPKTATTQKKNDQQQRRPKADYPARGGPRNVFKGDRDAAPAGGDQGNRNEGAEDRGGRGERGRGRGRGRGEFSDRGGGRGRGRGGRGEFRGGNRREFDRRSGTGIRDTNKQEVQGWGGADPQREFDAENQGQKDAAADWGSPSAPADAAPGWGGAAPAEGEAASGWDAPAAGEGKASGWDAPPAGEAQVNGTAEGDAAEERAPTPEDVTKTFEEYLAEKKAKEDAFKNELQQTQIRRANEGADESQWKGGVEVQKKGAEEDEFYSGKTKAARQRSKKDNKVYLEVDVQFANPSGGRGGFRGDRRGRGRGGGDRGDRGGRGGRGRGSGGGNRGKGPQNVAVDDESAFPSLS